MYLVKFISLLLFVRAVDATSEDINLGGLARKLYEWASLHDALFSASLICIYIKR